MAMARATSLTRNVLVRLTNRKVLQVAGVDAARFLQGVVANDVNDLKKPSDALYGAFLTTKGRILGDCNIVQMEASSFWLEYDAGVEPALLKHLKRYKLRMKVTLQDQSERFQTIAALPASIDHQSFAYLPSSDAVEAVFTRNERKASLEDGVVFRDPRGTEFGVRAILPTGASLDVPDDYVADDLQAYTDRRIFLGSSEGSELSERIPLESNMDLLHGLSFDKGCYVGQELTARAQFKGQIRKRLVPIALVPASAPDIVQQMQALPFDSIASDSLAPLRQWLASHSTDMQRPADGATVKQLGITKPAGSIVSLSQGPLVAVSMLRLEHLQSQPNHSQSLTTADGAFHVVPFRPVWWPALDAETGKVQV